MKEKIKEFLRKNDFLPTDEWHYFEILHKGSIPNSKKKKEDFEKIKNQVSKKSGLYIYKKGKIIYVGKGKPLLGRIKNHYRSAYEEVPGDTKNKKFHKFFSSGANLGKLKIYWREEKDEKIRQVIEKMLDYVLEPTFDKYEPKN